MGEEQLTESQEVTQVEPEQDSLTAEDVQSAVENALASRDAHDLVVEDMANAVVELRDSVALLASSAGEDEQAGDDVVYTVRLDSSQVEVAKGCARLICTEGLLIVILLAILCGLQVWRVLSCRWSNG